MMNWFTTQNHRKIYVFKQTRIYFPTVSLLDLSITNKEIEKFSKGIR